MACHVHLQSVVRVSLQAGSQSEAWVKRTKPRDAHSAMKRLNSCLVVSGAWMKSNFLKLNDEKTELIYLGKPKRASKKGNTQLLVGDNAVKSSKSWGLL